MKRAILYLPYLAPYRLDVLNALSKEYDLLVLFAFRNAREHSFDYDDLYDKIEFKYDFLKTLTIGIRPIHPGLIWRLYLHKPDIIFSNEFGYFTSVVALIYRRIFGCKHVLTTSDNSSIFSNIIYIRRKLRDIAVQNSSGIVVYTPYVASLYRKEYHGYEVQVCPNIQNKFPVGNTFKKNFERKDDIFRFCYVGRFDHLKGLDILVEALALLDTSEWELNLVGYGRAEKEIRELISLKKLSKNVKIHGRLSGHELRDFYICNDIFVLPSRYEPFGAVVNEALCLGLPCVVSSICGSRMYIEEGINGYVFDSESIDDLLMSLKRSMSNYTMLVNNDLWKYRVEDYIGAYSYHNFSNRSC